MSSNNNRQRYSQRLAEKKKQNIGSAASISSQLNKNSCRKSCSSARNSWLLRRQAIATSLRVGDSILIWLNLSDTGLWWSCEVLSLSLINRFSNCEGVPDPGQGVEVEKEEGFSILE